MKANLMVLTALALALLPTAKAAIVIHGSATGYQSTNKDWLSETTNDIDGNGLGTDGYIFFGNFPVTPAGNNTNPPNDQNGNIFGANVMSSTLLSASKPSYVSTAATGPDSTNIGRFGYDLIDSPLLGDGTDRVAGNLLVASNPGRALEFTISGLAVGTTVRVGVLGTVINDATARFDSPSIGLTDGVNTAMVTGLPNISGNTVNSVGWVFFDINSNGNYTILVPIDTSGVDPDVTGLGGVTFDSIPEPSALTLLGLGAAGLLIRRRRLS